ncbi:MAG: hypothetical protein FWC49_03550 [Proteobacteria bacterium]|nr:hypothetical protein [Pseudomonadota bacterium]
MALPKALLCLLGKGGSGTSPEEGALRAAGFATASIAWDEVAGQRNGWTQLLPILEEPAVQAWVLAGSAEDFTAEVLSRMALLTLALRRPKLPVTACVLSGGNGEPEFPDLLGHVRVFSGAAAFAARLAAMRLKPPVLARPDFHADAHPDPLIGLWLEVGPPPGAVWRGFMAGVLAGEVTAFGVGPRGTVPQKTTLEYPQCGIQGDWGGSPFTACAARNPVDGDTACYMRVEGAPRAIFITPHPDDEEQARPLCYLALG